MNKVSLKMLPIAYAKNLFLFSCALLGWILPIVIGDLEPERDPHWENYLLLMRIADILFIQSQNS